MSLDLSPSLLLSAGVVVTVSLGELGPLLGCPGALGVTSVPPSVSCSCCDDVAGMHKVKLFITTDKHTHEDKLAEGNDDRILFLGKLTGFLDNCKKYILKSLLTLGC